MEKPKKINPAELRGILRLHEMWLAGMEGGERAVLRGADLDGLNMSRANLRRADLSEAAMDEAVMAEVDLTEADMSKASLEWANLRGAKMVRANLRGTDLSMTDLSGADLSGADLEYSCWPLWCGGLHIKTDRGIMAQLAYHFCSQDCSDPDYIRARNAILDFANSFSRAGELGFLMPLPEPPPPNSGRS